MPKLIYLYTSGGAPRRELNNLPVNWDPNTETYNRYARAAMSDGMIHLFKHLKDLNLIDQFIAVIDSAISPGYITLGVGSELRVVPAMGWAKHFINPGDILIVRGGFKAWIPLLNYIHSQQLNWILFYRANTSRHGWPYWDIILNDLIDTNTCIRGRLNYAFSKPVNEDIFGHIDATNTLPKEYDIMIGASHIHRKKGQYLTVQALQEYYRKYGTKPKAILPGGFMRCSTNSIIQTILRSGDVDIEGPINLPRHQLALTMNRTKLFVHAGYGGQNDRGILEAMCCGCLPLLFGKQHVSPAIWHNSAHIEQNPFNIADEIRKALFWYDDTLCTRNIANKYHTINGLDEVVIPKMRRLLSFIEHNPFPNRSAACRRFVGGT